MAYVNINGYAFLPHPKTDAPTMHCKGHTLADVYGSWSHEKQRAYDYCRGMYKDLDGWGFCISGFNCMTFSVMFDFAHPDTGEMMRAKITRDYNHLYYL